MRILLIALGYLMGVVPGVGFNHILEFYFINKFATLAESKGSTLEKLDKKYKILDYFMEIPADFITWREEKKKFKIKKVIEYLPFINLFLVVYNMVKLGKVFDATKEAYIQKTNDNLETKDSINSNVTEDTLKIKEEKVYFIGYYHESRPINIFFTYEGGKLTIMDYSAKAIFKMSGEERSGVLLYLLYLVYSGYNGPEVNRSANINEVFDESLISTIVDFFEGNGYVALQSSTSNISKSDKVRGRMR